MILSTPKRRHLAAMNPGDVAVFEHPRGRQSCANAITALQARHGGKFTTSTATLIIGSDCHTVTIVNCFAKMADAGRTETSAEG